MGFSEWSLLEAVLRECVFACAMSLLFNSLVQSHLTHTHTHTQVKCAEQSMHVFQNKIKLHWRFRLMNMVNVNSALDCMRLNLLLKHF